MTAAMPIRNEQLDSIVTEEVRNRIGGHVYVQGCWVTDSGVVVWLGEDTCDMCGATKGPPLGDLMKCAICKTVTPAAWEAELQFPSSVTASRATPAAVLENALRIGYVLETVGEKIQRGLSGGRA